MCVKRGLLVVSARVLRLFCPRYLHAGNVYERQSTIVPTPASPVYFILVKF